MNKRKRLLLMAPFAIVGIVVFAFIGGEVVRLLWNWLLPELFGFPQITFWQALGLLALCRILFGGSGIMGGRRSRFGPRLDPMTAEQREHFRQRVHERWGVGPSTTESKEQ
jgi:hypothetical protein